MGICTPKETLAATLCLLGQVHIYSAALAHRQGLQVIAGVTLAMIAVTSPLYLPGTTPSHMLLSNS